MCSGLLECHLSEVVRERAEQLVAVVLDLDGGALVGKGHYLARGVVDVLSRQTVHVGIEIARAHLVLIGQVDTELIEIETHAGSQAIG